MLQNIDIATPWDSFEEVAADNLTAARQALGFQRALRGFHRGRQIEDDAAHLRAMKGTQDVRDALRAEGYRVSSAYLAWLLRDRWLESPEKAPGGAFVWGDADIARLRSLLYRRGRGPKGGVQ